MLEKLVAIYVKALKMFLFSLAFAMVALVFVNLVLRYGFASGIAASEELARWALVWAGFVGATVALIERGHLSVRVLVDALPDTLAHLSVLLAQTLSFAAMVFLLHGVWSQAVLNMSMRGPITGLPLGVMLYGAGLFFAVNACVIIPVQIGKAWTSKARRWQES